MEFWHQIINACVAILPVVIYIVVVYTIDRFSLISLRRLMLLVLCGVLAAALCFGIFQLWSVDSQLSTFNFQLSTFTDTIVEELVKAIPLLFLTRRKKIVFFIDSVICGAAVGGGFCIAENMLYLLGDPMGIGTAVFRGLEVALIHMGCSAFVAAGLMFAVRLQERHHSRLEIKRKDIGMTILLLLSAPLLHIFHNALLTFNFQFSTLNLPLVQFAVVFGTMGGLLVWIWQYDTNMIHSWIDRGLDNQLELILAIREGHLPQTPTGQFLMTVKDAFPPEVFFDLICYVQLHIELSVAAKSLFMTREAGMECLFDEERRSTLLSQHQEYRQLERSLGSTARKSIAPLLKINPADRKALEDLIKECKTLL